MNRMHLFGLNDTTSLMDDNKIKRQIIVIFCYIFLQYKKRVTFVGARFSRNENKGYY